MKGGTYMILVWAILFIAFICIEASTVSLVSIWFAAGALAAAIVELAGGEIWLQVFLFIGVSGITLAALRPITRKYFTPKLTKTNVDSVIGTTGKVLACIDNDAAAGRVKLGAMEWTARSTDGTKIEEGKLIRVDKVEGVKVYVSPVKAEEKI